MKKRMTSNVIKEGSAPICANGMNGGKNPCHHRGKNGRRKRCECNTL